LKTTDNRQKKVPHNPAPRNHQILTDNTTTSDNTFTPNHPDEDVKGVTPAELIDGKPIPASLRFYFECAMLKQRYRRGWLQRGVPPGQGESVSDHSFGTALLAMLLADSEPDALNREKTIGMALLHELGEIDAGDITPADGIPKPDRERMELESVDRLAELGSEAEGAAALWREFEEGKTPEARFVRQLDKLEMVLQAFYYEETSGAQVENFFSKIEHVFTSRNIRDLFHKVRSLRSTGDEGETPV